MPIAQRTPRDREQASAALVPARGPGPGLTGQRHAMAQVKGPSRRSPGPGNPIGTGASGKGMRLQPSRSHFSRSRSPLQSVMTSQVASHLFDSGLGCAQLDLLDQEDSFADDNGDLFRFRGTSNVTGQLAITPDVRSQDSTMSFESAPGDVYYCDLAQLSEGSGAPDPNMDSPYQTTTSDISGPLMSVPGTPLSSALDHTFSEPQRPHDALGPRSSRSIAFLGHCSHNPNWWILQQDRRSTTRIFDRRSRSLNALQMDLDSFNDGTDTSGIVLEDHLLTESPRLFEDLRADETSTLEAIGSSVAVSEPTVDYYNSYDSPQSPDYYHTDSYEPDDEDMGDPEDVADNQSPPPTPNNGGPGFGPAGDADNGAPKRGRGSDGDDQGDWSNNKDSRQNKRSRHDFIEPLASQSHRRFACPYQKFDPAGEPSCGHPKNSNPTGGFKDVNRLKAHLKECHDPLPRCKRCWHNFKQERNEDQGRALVRLQAHVNRGDCPLKAPPKKFWMTPDQKADLSAQHYGDDVDRWYQFMHLLLQQPFSSLTVEDLRKQYVPWYTPPSSWQNYPTPSSTDASSLLTPGANAPTPFPSTSPSSYPIAAAEGDVTNPGNARQQHQTASYLDISTVDQDFGPLFDTFSGNDDTMNTFIDTLEDPAPLQPPAATPAPPAVEPSETMMARTTATSTAGTTAPTHEQKQGSHLRADVGRLREKNRRLRDQINQTRGEITAVGTLLQRVLHGLALGEREQVARAAAMLEDIQCRLDEC